MHEIVTVQAGEAANYLGTHFWNAQESYFTYSAQQEPPVDHNIHFRPGIGTDGSETFTPRVLIYDFKNSFGTLRKLNEPYQTEDDQTRQQGIDGLSTIHHRQPSIPLHEYQRALNEDRSPPVLKSPSIRFWSDYNRVFYNPKSIMQIHEGDLGPQQAAFQDWSHGRELFETLNRERDLLDDDLRPLVEECDQIQGIQLLGSVDDGWGGFASEYVDSLRDEYGKSSLWVWALNGKTPKDRVERRVSISSQARSLANISPQASLYIPIARIPSLLPEYLQIERESLWSTSAAQCCAWETISLPSRLKTSTSQQSASLDELATALGTDESQRVAKLDFSMQPHGSELGMMNGTNGKLHPPPETCGLFPFQSTSHREYKKIEVLRGSHLDELTGEDDPSTALDLRFSVRAALTKSSIISEWVRHLKDGSRLHFAIDERETLLDGLGQIASAYNESTADSEGTWDD